MKKLHQSFDVDSHSTQQKQKRFRRQSSSKSPKSASNKSNDSSLSKFWVRNLKLTGSGKQLESIISTQIHSNGDWSPPRRKPTPAKGNSQIQQNLCKVPGLQEQKRQIKELRQEIEKYQAYIRSQNEKMSDLRKKGQGLQKKNKELQQKLHQQSARIQALDEDIKKLNNRINQKDVLVEILQKEQSAIKKVKTTILQTRVLEYEKQRQEQNIRIKQLSMQIQKCRSSPKSPLRSQIAFPANTPSFLFGSECKQNYEMVVKQLYETRQEMKRMEIAQACAQRKHLKEMQALKQRKQKDYEELRKKFSQLLQKYRVNMKKVASQQIRSYKECKSRRSQSKDSIDSLAFSSDQEFRA